MKKCKVCGTELEELRIIDMIALCCPNDCREIK